MNELLGAALDQGLNVIDTAECYSGSEELIGKAASHRRNDFYLFTKCGHGAQLLGREMDRQRCGGADRSQSEALKSRFC